MWSVLLAVIVSAIGAILYRMYRARYAFADKWPTLPPYYPLVGSALMVVGKDAVERFDLLRPKSHQNERITTVWAGPRPFLVTSHPDLVHQILTSPACLDKPVEYRFFGFEEGLLSAKYHTWKIARKQLNPTFNLRIIHGFIPIFARCVEKLAARLNELADGETVNIHKFTAMCTLEMACGTTLGSDVFEREGKEELEEALDQAFNGTATRMMNVHLHPDCVYRFTRHHTELAKARKTSCDFYSKLVDERKKFLTEQQHNSAEGNENSDDVCEKKDRNKPKILIDLLLTTSPDGKQFTEKQIMDHIYTVIAGAVDTTGLLIAHACLLMCFHPEMQDRLYDEISKYFPTGLTDVQFTAETLKQLTYTEMLLNEVLRLWTIVPMIGRKNIAEIELDGVKVPPGNSFILDLYAMHRRQDVWGPDADRFEPERFSEERFKSIQAVAFKPFTGGSYRYTSFSMKMIMVSLVRNFRFSSRIKPEDVRFKIDLTLKLPFEHLVQVHKRHPKKVSIG